MADINPYFRKLLPHEGGYVNNAHDAGGATNMGVTIATWQRMGYDKNHDGHIDLEDIKLLSPDDAKMILKKGYWDGWKADLIHNQSIAETLVEWIWGSGAWGVRIPQRILGLKEDGVVGPATIAAVNNANQKEFYDKLIVAKHKFIDDLCKNHPENNDFKAGWYKRISDIPFIA